MEIKQALKNYGLKDEEINLYLSGLKLGESPLSILAKDAGIKRSSAYLIAQSLEQKGLMGNFRMKKGLRFVVSPPAFLLDQLNKRTQEISQIMPELKSFQGKHLPKPRITTYEGNEGYFLVLEDSLKSGEKIIRSIGSVAKLYEIINSDYDKNYYIPGRIANKISLKSLFFEKETTGIFKPDNNSKQLREVKFLPPNISHPALILIYGNVVAIFTSKKELITTKIESPDIAESERNKFDLLWDSL